MSKENYEEKYSYPSSKRSSKKDLIQQSIKSNRMIDSEPRKKEFKGERFGKYNISKVNSNSNLDKLKIFNSTYYVSDSNRNGFRTNLNDLPPLNGRQNLEERKFARTHYRSNKITVKILKKKLNELNGEINKLRNDANVQNYNILELNYKQKAKELTELKQENNFIRFQLEDILRKNSKNKSIKKNNYIGKNKVKSNSSNKSQNTKLGDIYDFHNKFFLQKIKLEEDNKDKNFEKEIKNEMNKIKIEELKKKIESANKELDKYKTILISTKDENEELKINIQKLNNKLLSTQNAISNNDKSEKIILTKRILELKDEKDSLKNELNNLRKNNDKNKNTIMEENNRNKKEINELKKRIEANKEIKNKETERYLKEISELKKQIEEKNSLNEKSNNEKEKYIKEINKLKKENEANKESNIKEKEKYNKQINE